jgi:hypothetical protein
MVCPENRNINFLKSMCGQFHEIDEETDLVHSRKIFSLSILCLSATGTIYHEYYRANAAKHLKTGILQLNCNLECVIM